MSAADESRFASKIGKERERLKNEEELDIHSFKNILRTSMAALVQTILNKEVEVQIKNQKLLLRKKRLTCYVFSVGLCFI